MAGVRAKRASQKFWDPLLISATIEASNFKFGTQIGFGKLCAKKQHLGPKLAGARPRGAFQTFWDPSLFLYPLKLATSDLVHNMVWGVCYNNSFSNKLGRGWLVYRSTSKIVWTRYHVFYMVPCTLYHVIAAEM